MQAQLPTLTAGMALMAVGAGWLAIAAVAKAAFGDEATMMKYGFHPPAGRHLEYFKKFRPVYMAIVRWVVRPGGWAMIVGGAGMSIIGLVERFSTAGT